MDDARLAAEAKGAAEVALQSKDIEDARIEAEAKAAAGAARNIRLARVAAEARATADAALKNKKLEDARIARIAAATLERRIERRRSGLCSWKVIERSCTKSGQGGNLRQRADNAQCL